MPRAEEGLTSSAPDVVDVAVIGGGPAGATAARLLATWGRTTLLAARRPSQHALAESLPPSCVKLFTQLGITATVDGAGFLRATGNTVNWGAGGERVEYFPDGALGYQVSRDAFDALLVGAANGAGARVEPNAVVRGIERGADEWTVTYDVPERTSTVRARCVLDCSGRTGVVARDGWRRASTVGRTLAVMGVWERDEGWGACVPDESHTLVESYAGGWAWSVPVSRQRRFVTVMIDPDVTTLPGRRHLGAAYAMELAQTHRLRALVDGATPCGEPWARDASAYTAERFGEIGLLLVGDAASFVDPLSSYGVKKAMASAWLAAIVANTWCIDSSVADAALELFNRRERTMYDRLQQQASALARAAADAHAGDFWAGRADVDVAGDGQGEAELDIDGLRRDPRVRAAFAELKRRTSVHLRLAPQVRVTSRPIVRGERVVLEDHLSVPGVAGDVRYARNIDLLLLARIAEHHDQVPDIFESYNRRARPASLPDFLGALATLVGLEMLTLA